MTFSSWNLFAVVETADLHHSGFGLTWLFQCCRSLYNFASAFGLSPHNKKINPMADFLLEKETKTLQILANFVQDFN